MLYSFRNRSPEIGKDTYVSEHALITGNVKTGDNCYIGHGAIIHSCSVGDMAVIGMGAVLSLCSELAPTPLSQRVPSLKWVKPGVIAGGSTAKVIRDINEKDKKLRGWGKQVYIDLAKEYLRDGMPKVA